MPVTAEQREIYRQHFAVLFNDFFLFDDVDNVHERTAGHVEKLLHLLKLDHKVAFRDGRFTTTALSQGQRKRLALLQAWLENRPFICLTSGRRTRIQALKRCSTRCCCQC